MKLSDYTPTVKLHLIGAFIYSVTLITAVAIVITLFVAVWLMIIDFWTVVV